MLSLTVSPQNFSTPQNAPLTISPSQLLAGDSDGNVVLQASNLTQPAHDATLVANPDGTFTFTPSLNFKGSTAFTYTVSAAAPQTEVTASDGVSHADFGRSVAIDGDTAVVGAVAQTINGVQQGAAYVFVRSGKAWVEQAELSAPEGVSLEGFGIAVAVSGDTVVVGDDRRVVNGQSQGAAYVFVRSGTSWNQQAELTAADGASGDDFGWSVALSGNTLLVGDSNHGNASQGAAYVFSRSGTTWTQQAELSAPDPQQDAAFGDSVAMSGNTLAIGAPVSGNTYVFVGSGSTWSLQAELTGGGSAAIDGDTLVTGDRTALVSGVGQGAAYVYVRSGATWNQQAELTAADGAQNDDFGVSVAINGDTALIGADGRTVNGHLGQGAVYQFVRSGTSWSQTNELTAADGAQDDELGYTMAISGDTALTGALSRTVDGNTSQGAAYFLELASSPATATVDVGLPTSAVSPLPTFSPTSFTVSWSGSDATGPGIASYSVFVSDDGGPFTPLVSNTTTTSAPFTGQAGHTYGFYSVATDSLGGTQSTPGRAQATTTVAAPVQPPTANPDTFVLGSNAAASSGSGPTSVLANDTSADGQPQNLVATLVSTTTNGNLTLNSDGSFTYTPGPTFQGVDRFTYQVTEGITAGNTATVTLLSYNASLVDKLYHQVLHRSAEDGGLLYWTGQLDQGLPLDVVATGIFNSTERLDPLVTQFYQQYLNRGTDSGGLAYWVNDWQTRGDPRDVVENILASQEFFDDAGDTNAGFVTLLYERVLQRNPESSGLNYWVSLMSNPPTNPPETRFAIASQFYDTHEKHVDLVNFLFGEYFNGVSPLPSTQPYVADLDFPSSETETQVEKAIIDSPTYGSNPPAPAVGTVSKPLYPH